MNLNLVILTNFIEKKGLTFSLLTITNLIHAHFTHISGLNFTHISGLNFTHISGLN